MLSASTSTGENAPPLLDIQNLTVRHPRPFSRILAKRRVVDSVRNVSLRLADGESAGLVGESGSGKSTIALAILGLTPASMGTIRLLGVDVTRASRKTIQRMRPNAQIVFQNPHAAFDPRQYIEAGLRELRRLHPTRTNWIRDQELLGLVGLPAALLERLPRELSGGQAQRVAIARALLLRPRLIIADEPTSALDVSVQAQILNLLTDLQKRFRIALLLISHDLCVVRQICERIYVLQRGEIVEEGNVEQTLTNPRHPATMALINAIPGRFLGEPSLEPKRSTTLTSTHQSASGH